MRIPSRAGDRGAGRDARRRAATSLIRPPTTRVPNASMQYNIAPPRVRFRRASQLARRRSVLVSLAHADRYRPRAGRSGARDANQAVRRPAPRRRVARRVRAAADSLRAARTQTRYSSDGRTIDVTIAGSRVSCSVEAARCDSTAADPGDAAARAAAGDAVARRKAGRVHPRLESLGARRRHRSETQLTTDGVKDFGYATDNAGWCTAIAAILPWSPDSKKIATFQQDQRNVGEMYLVRTKVGHPDAEAWKYPLVGDSVVTMIQRVIIDVSDAAPKTIRLQMPPDSASLDARATTSRAIGRLTDVEWNPDGSQLAFVSTSRDHKHEVFRVADAATGAVRDVFDEDGRDAVRVGHGGVNWRVLPASNEVIWFSRARQLGPALSLRSHDRQAQAADHDRRGQRRRSCCASTRRRARCSSTATARRKGRDPYFRISTRSASTARDTSLLTPDDGDHTMQLSPTGKYFVDTYSQPGRAAAGHGASRRRRQARARRSRRPTSRSSWRPAGSRRCRSR